MSDKLTMKKLDARLTCQEKGHDWGKIADKSRRVWTVIDPFPELDGGRFFEELIIKRTCERCGKAETFTIDLDSSKKVLAKKLYDIARFVAGMKVDAS